MAQVLIGRLPTKGSCPHAALSGPYNASAHEVGTEDAISQSRPKLLQVCHDRTAVIVINISYLFIFKIREKLIVL